MGGALTAQANEVASHVHSVIMKGAGHWLMEERPQEVPYFQRARPCTLLIDELEGVWDAIAARDDWAPLDAKIASIREMGDARSTP